MLNPDTKATLQKYTEEMTKKVSLVINNDAHDKKSTLEDFLSDVASVTPKIEVIYEQAFHGERFNTQLRSGLSFFIAVDQESTGIIFTGIPTGHEFNSLILAILQAGGASEIKLDSSIQQLIKQQTSPLNFSTFISLSCHVCPDIVQTLNQFALLNPLIQNEMIDSQYYQALLDEKNIHGVPTVLLNGEECAHGKDAISEIIELLQQKSPVIAPTSSIEKQDIIVVGAGPAGASAAIYAARKGLKVMVLADTIGGQVKETQGIENLISVAETTGTALTGALIHHMAQYDIKLREHVKVTAISGDNLKTVTLSSGETIETQSVIIATGARWRELGVPGEKAYLGSGVAYCPHCDGPFFKGKDVVVVGGGNSGVEAALDLAGIVKSVTIIEFLPDLRADQVLLDQVNARDNINIIRNAATKEILGEKGHVNAIQYVDRATEAVKTLPIDGVFVQIGLVPNSQWLDGIVPLTERGEIIIDEKCRTGVPGMFAAGDVTTTPYKQIIISMGEGAKAALSAYESILLQTTS